MKLMKTLLAIGAICAVVAQANAVMITGQIDMNGKATLNSQNLAAATSASFSNVQVGPAAATGSFAVIPLGTAVSYSAFTWNPITVPVIPLWTLNSGGTWSFDLNSMTVVAQTSSFLNITGTGVLTATGYDPTPGVWSFSITVAGGQSQANFDFNFVSTTASAPDGGLTMALMGFALVGVEGLRRRFSK